MMTIPFTGNLDAARRIKTCHRIDVTENAGTSAVARVQLKDTNSSGTLYCDIRLTLAEDKHITFDPPLQFPGGMYVQVSAGTVRGSVTGQ